MNSTLNAVRLIGYIGMKPNVIKTKTGKVVTASLATIEQVKRNEKWQKKIVWHSLIFSDCHAKFTAQLKPGNLINVEGKLRSKICEDSAGQYYQVSKILVNEVMVQVSNLNPNKEGTEALQLVAANENLEAIQKLLGSDLDELID